MAVDQEGKGRGGETERGQTRRGEAAYPFPDGQVGLVCSSLSLNAVGEVVGEAVVKGIRVHEDLVEFIEQSPLESLLLLVLFDL